MKLTKNQLREVHIGIVHYLLRIGITDNKDITQVIKPLLSHDKLRGVKRSITVSSDTKAKPLAAVPRQKGKPKAKAKLTVKAKVRTVEKPQNVAIVRNVALNGVDLVAAEEYEDFKAKHREYLNQARVYAYKEEIKRFCGYAARKAIRENNMTPEEIEAGDREVYREPYRTLYHQFDLVLERILARQGKSLEECGLNFKLNKNAYNYLERVAKAGFIKILYGVAKDLYANK
jgi:hypothetical protein